MSGPVQEALRALRERGILVETDTDSLESASRDFGGLVRGQSLAVVRPRTTREVQTIVEVARAQGVRLTPRGNGLSQSGQSIADRGITVALSQLSGVEELDLEGGFVRVRPGGNFRELVQLCAPRGVVPQVLPFNLDLSIGGVLSAGGFGSTSHRYGLVASGVQRCEVVLENGEVVQSGPRENRAVFDSVLGGVGRSGIITSVDLSLRKAGPRVQTVFLLYEDLSAVLQDLISLSREPRVDHLESFCSASLQGLRRGPGDRRVPLIEWFYALQFSVEFEEQAEDPREILSRLHFKKQLLVEEDELPRYLSRFDVRFDAMRTTGAWTQCHPWFEVLLPLESAQEFIQEALRSLPAFFGDGHRLMVFADTERPRSFPFPKSGPVVGFAVLPVGIAEPYREIALANLERLDSLAARLGGTRYPSGWLFSSPPNPPSLIHPASNPLSAPLSEGASEPAELVLDREGEPSESARSVSDGVNPLSQSSGLFSSCLLPS